VTGIVGAEELCPTPGELVFRVLLGQAIGQEQGNTVLSVDLTQLFAQHLTVKEEEGIESLVLAAGRDISLTGQVTEKSLDPVLTGKVPGHLSQGDAISEQGEGNGLQ
jgi:hypothetical protein